MIAHWMATAVKRVGLEGADRLVLAPQASVHEAWSKACRACELEPMELASAIASAFSMDTVDIAVAEPTAARLLSGSIARKFCVFPVRDENRYLVVATPNPTDLNADQEVGFTSGRMARFVVAPPSLITDAIESTYSDDLTAAAMLARLETSELAGVDVELAAEGPAAEKVTEAELAAGPVVRLANIILQSAINCRASDIHIQPLLADGVVRFRTDGVLHNAMQLPLPVLARVVSRIKIMSQLDITDRLRPQDGRTRLVVGGRKYDMRVSTVPTRGAERAVIRILDTAHELHRQAVPDAMTTLFESKLEAPGAHAVSSEAPLAIFHPEAQPALGPARAPSVSAVQAVRGPGLVASTEVSIDGPPHVLVVDDDGTTRAIARGVLQAAGYRVSEAKDGAEALVMLARGEHFSLMLLDLDMPTIGGRDVLRSVRQSINTMGLPVVVLTGTPDRNAEVELMELGADDYLRKPIDPPLLSIRIKAAMRRTRG